MKRRAFTLVELLVVIGIIALLISMLLPALKKARDQAITANCLSNLRQVGQYIAMYAQENNNFVPHTGYNASWNVRHAVNNNFAAGLTSLRLGTWPERIVISGQYKVKTDWFNGHFQIQGRPGTPFRCPGFGEGVYENGTAVTLGGEANHDVAGYAGYGMNLWYAQDGNMGAIVVPNTNYWVKFNKVKGNRVLLCDGYSRIYSGIYQMDATSKQGSIYIGNGYGVYLRHTGFKGANYLFGDMHAEWSAEYHKHKWAPPAGQFSVWYVDGIQDQSKLYVEKQLP